MKKVRGTKYKVQGSFLIILILLLISCGEPQRQKPFEIDSKKLKENVNRANKPAVVMEQDEINAYIRSHGYTMQSTGSGLRYMILKENPKGKKIEDKQEVKVNYKVWLL